MKLTVYTYSSCVHAQFNPHTVWEKAIAGKKCECVSLLLRSTCKLLAFSLLSYSLVFWADDPQGFFSWCWLNWHWPGNYWATEILYTDCKLEKMTFSPWVGVFILHAPSGWQVTAKLLSNFAIRHIHDEDTNTPSKSLSVDVKSRFHMSKYSDGLDID